MKALKIIGIILLSIAILLTITYILLPKEPGELLDFDDPYRKDRALAESDNYMAATGTPYK